MGDRINISFTDGYTTSAEVYSHWGGRGMIKAVERFVKDLGEARIKEADPQLVMVWFIKWMTGDVEYGNIDLSLHSEGDSDYSDNGLWVYNTEKCEWED